MAAECNTSSNTLRAVREQLGLTPLELASRPGISALQVAQCEAKNRLPCSLLVRSRTEALAERAGLAAPL